MALMLHNTRFDRLRVGFVYADGLTQWQQVATGAFGAHWRAGGQILFSAPDRRVAPVALVLRFDRLASVHLLRMRLLGVDEANLQANVLAAAVGCALTLLFLGAIYNTALAIAVRRQFPAWLGAWAACMVLWGFFWSQFDLLMNGALAGAPSSQICTALACLAVTLATQGAVTALARDTVPVALRRVTIGCGLATGALGIPASLVRGSSIDAWGAVLGIATLADLVAVALCLGIAWRRGSGEARAFAGAWAVPMVVLATTQVVDTASLFWGGGAQMLVLLGATWQTLWISVAATHRLTRIRLERDRARQAEATAHELARRDPLTGLRNRRGLVEAVDAMIGQGEDEHSPFALLLVDVDKFKTINDTHGHEVGDQVLCRLAGRLSRWDGAMCAVARFGGEEFAMVVVGLSGPVLTQFADRVRQEVAECDHGPALRAVTVSIGIAEARGAADFQSLYRLADEALYRAKQAGRNCVMSAGRPGGDGILPASMERELERVERVSLKHTYS
ncbi:diguanylate cyclase [Novosphingobium nitrogenifigens DSM 19370]|uniref:diguanylate cyclase n=2 Tax=Novosphingobium nitrogenifigens TaxID=378548 RepID=F1Z661_9SPHN|nr:diguanylate cyclase [Novosphingobium nitrogenifigens DSM 19370]